MSTLEPLETLYGVDRGSFLPLPSELASIYGRLAFPPHSGRPYVIGNFVATLDGVTSLQAPGHVVGSPISGANPHDHFVMGLLRAAADAVIVGAGTLRAGTHHAWTPDHACPAFAGAYRRFRDALGKPGLPLNVIVTARGDVDPSWPLFRSGEVPVLIVTTAAGAQRLRGRRWPRPVQVLEGEGATRLSTRSVLGAEARVRAGDLVLVEGGPHLLGDFFAEQCLDEQFLTLAPQVAGRDGTPWRPGLVAGKRFAPEHPLWGTLVGVKRGGSHLFLRYAFSSPR
jgi:riboflavin biosynthesis pyrimidine reductase